MIVVNADDLGTSQPINDATFALMERGLVTSATLIGNAPAVADAAMKVSAYPACSFGVHLNATVFAPLRPSPGLAPILNDSGHLSQKLWHARWTPKLIGAVYQELEAQVLSILELGVPISHFDSHQHIHCIPVVTAIVKRLQLRFGIRRMRSTINILPPAQPATLLRSVKKRLFHVTIRSVYATRTPDYFGPFEDAYAHVCQGTLPRGIVELMVHPGTSNSAYEREVGQLESDRLSRLGGNASLASYHVLVWMLVRPSRLEDAEEIAAVSLRNGLTSANASKRGYVCGYRIHFTTSFGMSLVVGSSKTRPASWLGTLTNVHMDVVILIPIQFTAIIAWPSAQAPDTARRRL